MRNQNLSHRGFKRVVRTIMTAILCVGLLNAFFAAGLSANPTTKDHDQALQAHDTIQGAGKQIQAMYAKLAEWEKLVITSTESAKAGRRFPHQQLSRIYPEAYRGIWYAEHLEAMGEPAGVDLKRRFTLLRNALGVFASWLQEFQAKEIATLTKQTPERRKILARASELADQGKLVEAERQIQTLHLKQLSSVFYLNSPQYRPFENEVNPPHNVLLGKLNAQRRKDYQEKAMAKINAYADAMKTLQSESIRIALELQQSPTVALGEGKTGDAADAIDYIAELWGNASAAVTRSVALAWAFGDGSAEAIAEPFESVIDQMESMGTTSLTEVLKSAARSTPADQVAILLPKVFSALAKIDRQCHRGLDDSVAAAVPQLTAKSPALAEQVKRYSDATVEPTRWMQRYASQQVENVGREYPLASNFLNQEMTIETSVQPAIYNPGASRTRILTPGSLSMPASWIAGDAISLVGMKIKDEGTFRLSASAKLAIVRQDPRHYANLPATFPIEKYVTELNDCLLLDGSHGPLNLSAADAQSSAVLQEFRNVGGRIVRLTLEPFISRFATMPDEAHILVPLNRLPSIDIRGAPIDKIIWRVDLQPDWVAHRLFFAKTP